MSKGGGRGSTTVAEHRVPVRRRLVTYGIAVALVLVVVIATVANVLYQHAHDGAGDSLSAFGVPRSEARCGPVLVDPASGTGVTVGPGTALPDVTHVDYPTIPPSSGEHAAVPVYPNLPFYDEKDSPQVEQLVHNLEHGYTILWYDPAVPQAVSDEVRDLATRIRLETPKFIAAPWDTSRGGLPGGATIALSHWGAGSGSRQLCGELSGAVVARFLAAHPANDSPDPSGP